MRDAERVRKRVLIADDHPLVRAGLSALLAGAPDLVVCGECGTLMETQRKTTAIKPDLLILDLSFGEGDSLNLIRSLSTRHPEVRILVCSMHEESLYAERVLKAGAMGYVSKDEAGDRVVSAARSVLEGQIYVSEGMRRGAPGVDATAAPRQASTVIDTLSNRELEVFGLIGRGRTTAEIAARLNLSVKTIETHRDKIKKKLGLKSGAELTHGAVQWVLLDRLERPDD